MKQIIRVLSNDPGYKNWGWCTCLVTLDGGVCKKIEVESLGVTQLYSDKASTEWQKIRSLSNFFTTKFSESWVNLVILEQQFQNVKMVGQTFETLKLSHYASGILGHLNKPFLLESPRKSKNFLEIRGTYQEKKKKMESLFGAEKTRLHTGANEFHHAADAIGLVYSFFKFHPLYGCMEDVIIPLPDGIINNEPINTQHGIP